MRRSLKSDDVPLAFALPSNPQQPGQPVVDLHGRFCGWLWKRTPRFSDTDKPGIRRLITGRFHASVFQKRWFQYSPVTQHLEYYREQPLGSSESMRPAGVIALKSISELRETSLDAADATAPTRWVFDVVCNSRVYSLCAADESAKDAWVAALGDAIRKVRGSGCKNKT